MSKFKVGDKVRVVRGPHSLGKEFVIKTMEPSLNPDRKYVYWGDPDSHLGYFERELELVVEPKFKIGDWVRIKKEDYNKPPSIYGYTKGDVFKIGYIDRLGSNPTTTTYWEDRDYSRGFFEDELELAVKESEFKVGDRVRFRHSLESRGFIIRNITRDDGNNVYWSEKGYLGRAHLLIKVEDPKPKVGDKVRVTTVREGIVTRLEAKFFDFKDASGYTYSASYAVSTVEILESKPVYPKWEVGHVVRSAGTGKLYTFNGQNFFDLFGSSVSVEDLEAHADLKIVSEPVKE